MGQARKDLYVLVADQDMRQTMAKLLGRNESLGIRSITYTVDRRLQRDSGCRTDASRYLQNPINHDYHHALVVFDKKCCGADASREEIQLEVEQELENEGWGNCARAIVIDPELEAWVSPHFSPGRCAYDEKGSIFEHLREFFRGFSGTDCAGRALAGLFALSAHMLPQT